MKRTLLLPLWWKAGRNLPIPLSLHLPPPFSSKQALHHVILCPLLSGVISHLISSSILGTHWPGEFIFQCSIFLPFHTIHGVLKARILKWFAIPFSSGPHSLHHDQSILGGPHRAWLSFIELDKAVVLMWLDWLVFCGYGFSCRVRDSNKEGGKIQSRYKLKLFS